MGCFATHILDDPSYYVWKFPLTQNVRLWNKMSTMESRMLVSKHLNLFLDICPVTLRCLDWCCSTTLRSHCRMVLFPLDSVILILRNLVLRLCEVIKGILFMIIKSHLWVTYFWNWIIGTGNGNQCICGYSGGFCRIIFPFDNISMNIFGPGNIFNRNFVIFKLALIYIFFGGGRPFFTGWKVHIRVLSFNSLFF